MDKNGFVYVCSPLSAASIDGIRKNMQKAAYYSSIVNMKLGCRAIAPHSFLPDYLDDNIPEERIAAIQIGLYLLQMSKAIVVCGGEVTEGMKGEIEKAKEWGIPIYSLIEHQSYISIFRIDEGVKENEKQICKANISE